MEEGGGNSVVEIEQRPERWVESGEQETVDLVDPDCDLETTPFFCKKAKLQPTWNKLIRILLSSQGSVPTTEQVRQYQRSSLGRHGGENCLVELLPLPSPSMRHWIYGNNSKLEYLKNRKTYQEHCLPWRVEHLKQRIAEHLPAVVIFYGSSYREHWHRIAGVDFELDGEVYLGRNEFTVFVITKHPTAKEVTNDYFHRIGMMIARPLRSQIHTISSASSDDGPVSHA